MRRTAVFCATVLLGGFVVSCGLAREEPLPAVRAPALFEGPQVCVAVPPPPLLEPDEQPMDPRKCLPKSWARPGLPVEVRVINGRVADFRFYEQCSGESVEVDDAVRECIRVSLATWRYPRWPVCPGQDSTSSDQLHLQPFPSPRVRAASAAIHRGCAGSGS